MHGKLNVQGKPKLVTILLCEENMKILNVNKDINFIGFQSCKNPNFENFRTKWHLGATPMAKHKEYYKGEGGGFIQVWAVVSLVNLCLSMACHMHQKCSNYALTNLLFGLCRFVWIIYLLVTHPSPHPGAPTCPSTLKMCCKLRNVPQLFILPLFSLLDSHLNLSRRLRVRHEHWISPFSILPQNLNSNIIPTHLLVNSNVWSSCPRP